VLPKCFAKHEKQLCSTIYTKLLKMGIFLKILLYYVIYKKIMIAIFLRKFWFGFGFKSTFWCCFCSGYICVMCGGAKDISLWSAECIDIVIEKNISQLEKWIGKIFKLKS